MTPSDLLSTVIAPALAEIGKDSPEARLQLLATAIQESALSHLEQVHGPAHSFWQEEPNGIKAVMRNSSVNHIAYNFCERNGYPWDEGHIYLTIATEPGQKLACCFARCLLLADPHHLPTIGDEEGAWEVYNRVWRPGKPDRNRWTLSYRSALSALGGSNEHS